MLAEHGWNPKLAVWEEPQTLLQKITKVELYSNSGEPPEKRFTMYCTDRHGLYQIHKKMKENNCITNEVGLTILCNFLPKFRERTPSYQQNMKQQDQFCTKCAANTGIKICLNLRCRHHAGAKEQQTLLLSCYVLMN